MLGKIAHFKGSSASDRAWGYIESKGKHYFFQAQDVVSGRKRLDRGHEVEFEEVSVLSSHVTARAKSVIVLPLEAEDA
jgi:hypothetical protein